MKCHETQEYFYEYLTNRLEQSLCEKVAEHLKSCKTCQQELSEIQTTIKILDHERYPNVSPDFTDRVMTQIENQAIPFYKRRFYKYVMRGAVAAVVVVAMAITLKLKFPSDGVPVIRGSGDTTLSTKSTCKKAVDLYNRGTMNLDLTNKEKLFKEALSCGCSDSKTLAKIYNNLADCFESQGRIDEALKEYSNALELDPELTVAYLGLGDVYKKKGNITETVRYYKKALELMQSDLSKGTADRSEIDKLKEELGQLEN